MTANEVKADTRALVERLRDVQISERQLGNDVGAEALSEAAAAIERLIHQRELSNAALQLLEVENAGLRENLDSARRSVVDLVARVAELTEQAKRADICDACTGSPVSPEPCICGGTGRGSDEKVGLRKEVLSLRPAADALAALEEWLRSGGERATFRPGEPSGVMAQIDDGICYDAHGPTLSAAIQSALEKARGT